MIKKKQQIKKIRTGIEKAKNKKDNYVHYPGGERR